MTVIVFVVVVVAHGSVVDVKTVIAAGVTVTRLVTGIRTIQTKAYQWLWWST